MIYQYTCDNIKALMQDMGTLEEAQLIRFFSNEMQPIRVKYMLDQYVIRRLFSYDEEKKIYQYMGAAHLTPEVADRRRLAFWVVANMGSTNVMDVYPIRYPCLMNVVSTDNISYDITVVESEDEARQAVRVRQNSQIAGGVDDVNHIAVLRRPSDAKKLHPVLQACGFDSYCTIDPTTKQPVWSTIDG